MRPFVPESYFSSSFPCQILANTCGFSTASPIYWLWWGGVRFCFCFFVQQAITQCESQSGGHVQELVGYVSRNREFQIL
jgi:hypothetical protein